jgi:hypothetical protein
MSGDYSAFFQGPISAAIAASREQTKPLLVIITGKRVASAKKI